jgi:hypothetical protein
MECSLSIFARSICARVPVKPLTVAWEELPSKTKLHLRCSIPSVKSARVQPPIRTQVVFLWGKVESQATAALRCSCHRDSIDCVPLPLPQSGRALFLTLLTMKHVLLSKWKVGREIVPSETIPRTSASHACRGTFADGKLAGVILAVYG